MITHSLDELLVFSGITLLFSILGRVTRGVTATGAVAGAVVCFAVLLAAGFGGFAGLFAVFVLTWAATRLGYERKRRIGLAEPRMGRTAAQVVANLGIAAACSLLYEFVWRDLRLLVCLAAALSEAAADTVSSEIGKAFGGGASLITTWKPVPAGADGGVTLLGTLAGVSSAILIGLACAAGGMFLWQLAVVSAAAGVVGMMADSVLGATLETRGILGNNAVNFLSTLIAAAVAFLAA